MYKVTSLIDTLLVVSSSGCLFNPFSLFSEDMPGKEAILATLADEEKEDLKFVGNTIYDFHTGKIENKDGSRQDLGVATVECHMWKAKTTRKGFTIIRCSMYYRINGEVVWPANLSLKSMPYGSMRMEIMNMYTHMARPYMPVRCKYRRFNVGVSSATKEEKVFDSVYDDVMASECKERP